MGMFAALVAPIVLLAPPERPRDVWIFRSVLDKRARMVTLALRDGLWVAYDATNCGLYKAWDGNVAFEGAVYTAVHGPQPRSVGDAYALRDPDATVWYLRQGGQSRKLKPTFRGYRLQNGRATLLYDLPVDGKTIRVEESPEYVPDRIAPDSRVGFERRFLAKGTLPAGAELQVGIPNALPAGEVSRDLLVDIPLMRVPMGRELVITQSFTRRRPVSSTKPVNAPAPRRVGRGSIYALATKPKIDGEPEAVWSQAPTLPLAQRFSGGERNADDLRAEANVGYDGEGLYLYVDVSDNAVRAEDGVSVSVGDHVYQFGALDTTNRQPEVQYQVKRRTGGYRVEAYVPWAVLGYVPKLGSEVPFNLWVTDFDGGAPATKMALLQGAPSGTVKLEAARESEPEDRQPREPGLAVRVYWTGMASERIPQLAANQTANVNFVSPTINFSNDAKLGGFGDYFVVHVSGFVRAPRAGKYEFQIASDDGSKLWIDDKLVIDNDGLHGAGEAKTGEVELTEGDHKIRMEYFENEGDAELYLGWKMPGSEKVETIASDYLSTPRGEVRVTSPGKKIALNTSLPNPPGDRRPLEGVHPSYDLATIRPPDFRPRVGGIDFLPDGRMVLCTWDEDGAVYILDGVRANSKRPVTVKRIAEGLAEPLGIKTVGKRIFVLQKQELTELVDLNGDETTDEYRAIANGWGVTDNFHEFAFGLVYKDGYFYANLATAINPGGSSTQPQNPDRGKTVKIGLDGRYSFVSHGLRTPNGVGLGYRDDIYLTDNQGDWLPSSKLLHLTEGAFFGNRSVNPTGTANLQEKLPVVWLPQGEIGNSPSQPAKLNDGPYRNQMILGDVTYGGLQRVFVEEVDRQFQGSVFRMTQGLEGGVNRICWGPDGSLYVGGIGSTGNWGQTGKERFGLQRMTNNGKPTFEMLAVRSRSNGFEIEFTEPLASGNGEDATSYNVDQFRYEPTKDYGGPKLDEAALPVRSVTLSSDRKRAFLELGGLKPKHVVHIRLDNNLRAKSGNRLWSTETWYTLNAIPKNRPGRVAPTPTPQVTDAERREGFVPLFDGKSVEGWIGYRKDRIPRGWKIVDGLLMYDPKAGDGGDLMTKEEYGSFELRLDWKVAPGGNSGIMYRVDDSLDIPWLTGPEMQVLDNDRHADGRSLLTSAGANYAMHPTDPTAFNGANQWNTVRIVVRGNDVEHWLNGKRVVKYTLGSPEWEAIYRQSKFRDMKDYGRRAKGHIVLQDHGDPVWYRNIRIKKL
jgi:cytochrome c